MTDRGAKVNTYRGDLRPAVVITLVIFVVHVAVAAVVVDEVTAPFWVVNLSLFSLYMAFFGVMAFQATRITITVYENGIDWGRGDVHMFTTWDNIDRIGRKDEGDSATFGLFLHEPIQPDADSRLDKRKVAAPVDYIRLMPTVPVPTRFKGAQGNTLDRDALAETDFGRDILRYAPRLLEA